MDEIKLSDLQKIDGDLGSVYHIYRDINVKVKEVYLSTVKAGKTKGWKLHKKMTLNLAVVKGDVKFYVENPVTEARSEFIIGDSNYKRLTVPPNFWVAFQGLGAENIVINVADYGHDEEEYIVRPVINEDLS